MVYVHGRNLLRPLWGVNGRGRLIIRPATVSRGKTSGFGEAKRFFAPP